MPVEEKLLEAIQLLTIEIRNLNQTMAKPRPRRLSAAAKARKIFTDHLINIGRSGYLA